MAHPHAKESDPLSHPPWTTRRSCRWWPSRAASQAPSQAPAPPSVALFRTVDVPGTEPGTRWWPSYSSRGGGVPGAPAAGDHRGRRARHAVVALALGWL